MRRGRMITLFIGLIFLTTIFVMSSFSMRQMCKSDANEYYTGYCSGICNQDGGCHLAYYLCQCTGVGSGCHCGGSSNCENLTQYQINGNWNDPLMCNY